MDLEGRVCGMTLVTSCRGCRIRGRFDRNCNYCYTNALFVPNVELWYLTFQGYSTHFPCDRFAVHHVKECSREPEYTNARYRTFAPSIRFHSVIRCSLRAVVIVVLPSGGKMEIPRSLIRS